MSSTYQPVAVVVEPSPARLLLLQHQGPPCCQGVHSFDSSFAFVVLVASVEHDALRSVAVARVE